MKNLSHTLQLDTFYKYGIGLFIAILCLFHIWLFFGLIMYIYLLRKQINILFFCFLFLCIYLPFAYINQPTDNDIEDIFRIVDIDDYEFYQRLTLKKGIKKYHFYTYQNIYNIGDEIYLNGEISLYKERTTQYGFDVKMYFLGHGIYGTINSEEILIVAHKFHINELRDHLMQGVKEQSSSYLNAFIFGEHIKDEHTKSIYEDFNIIYLFTVSGMHLFVLVLLFKKAMFYLNFRENYQHMVIIFLLLFLCLLNQFHYAVLRVMLIYLLRVFNKKYKCSFQHLDLICMAFFIMIIFNIHWLFNQGFLLTFLILITIELFHPLYHSFAIYIKQLIITTLITIVLVPFFSEIYILQILCLPIIISVIIYIIYPLAILSSLSLNFFTIFQSMIIVFEKFIKLLSNHQVSFYIPKFNIYLTLIYYGLFIWICFGKNKIYVFKRFFYACLLMITLVIYQLRFYQERIVFLDVGQGDTTIIQANACEMVIDSFHGTLDFLTNHGIYHLDYLVLTHSDEDHILEAENIIKTINVDTILISEYDDNYPDFKQKTIGVEAFDKFICGNLVLNILGPLKSYNNDNNNSIVLRFNYDHKDFLFTGDIETEAELDLIRAHKELLRSDVIKVPHHGSLTSSSIEFLAYVNPSFAVISLKTPNSYGFPSEDVLSRYINKHATIYRTDQHGTIIYHGKKRKEKWSVYLSI